MIVRLDLTKAIRENLLVYREQYFETYEVRITGIMRGGQLVSTIKSDEISQPYKMLMNSPLLICVEGHYIKVSDLVKVCNYRDVPRVLAFQQACLTGSLPPSIQWRWNREN